MDNDNSENPGNYGAMLAAVRRRRWYVWSLILGYLPATAIILKLSQSTKATGIFFLVWFISLIVAMALLAAAKCPRCGNSFHMANSTLSFFARCRHCGIHVSGDEG